MLNWLIVAWIIILLGFFLFACSYFAIEDKEIGIAKFMAGLAAFVTWCGFLLLSGTWTTAVSIAFGW